jgi:hypothetical protein
VSAGPQLPEIIRALRDFWPAADTTNDSSLKAGILPAGCVMALACNLGLVVYRIELKINLVQVSD